MYFFPLLPSSTFSSSPIPPPEAVLINNNNDDNSYLLPVNLRARIGANSAGILNGRDNPDVTARIRNTIDNALAAAVAAANDPTDPTNERLHNRRETIFGDHFHSMLLPSISLRRLRPISSGRGGAADTPPRAGASESLHSVGNVRPGTPTAARIRPPIASATRPNRTVVSLSGATVQSSLDRSASARSSGSLPIRVVSSRQTPSTSASSSANRSSTTRRSNVSMLNAVQSGETSTQNDRLPTSIMVTAKQIPRQDGQLQYHITNSAGLIFGNDVLTQVMEKVTTHFRRAHALALHRNEETPTEVTFRMSTP